VRGVAAVTGDRARQELRLPSRPVLSHSADGVRAGGLLFLAGVLPADADGNLVGGHDIVAQTTKVRDDAGAILALGGATWADVVKLSVYLTDVDEEPQVRDVLGAALGGTTVAATIVEVTGLAVPDARVELDGVAVVA
jgi:2-iminobutanoate/2-iminopropanoate deaminase